jgi:rubrerythrin
MEWTTLYTGFADVAQQEGFKNVTTVFKRVAEVEQWHERRYNKLIQSLESGNVFKRPDKALWKCRNCGLVIEAAKAPDICPTCAHPQAYFELYAENY